MMKQILLIATITMGLVLLGCGKSDEDSSPDGGAETPQAPNVTIHEAAEKGDLETIKNTLRPRQTSIPRMARTGKPRSIGQLPGDRQKSPNY